MRSFSSWEFDKKDLQKLYTAGALAGVAGVATGISCAVYKLQAKSADDAARKEDTQARKDDAAEDARRRAAGLPIAPAKRDLASTEDVVLDAHGPAPELRYRYRSRDWLKKRCKKRKYISQYKRRYPKPGNKA